MRDVVNMMARTVRVETNTGYTLSAAFRVLSFQKSEIFVSRQAKHFALARQLRRTCLPAILGDTRRYFLFVHSLPVRMYAIRLDFFLFQEIGTGIKLMT
jgi:hypothetical protein